MDIQKGLRMLRQSSSHLSTYSNPPTQGIASSESDSFVLCKNPLFEYQSNLSCNILIPSYLSYNITVVR